MPVIKTFLLKALFAVRIFKHFEKIRELILFLVFENGTHIAGRAVRRFSSWCALTAARCGILSRGASFRSRSAPFFIVLRSADSLVCRFMSW